MYAMSIMKKLSITTAGAALLTLGTIAPVKAASFYSITDLGTLGGEESYANAINNSGQVVGWSYTSSGAQRGFLWENNAMTNLGTLPGGNASEARSINNNGDIVGWSTTASDQQHAVLWPENGQIQDIDPTSSNSQANDINDNGQAVGVSDGRAFIWSNQTGKQNLCPAGNEEPIEVCFTTEALGINNAGQVVYSYQNSFLSSGINLWQNGQDISRVNGSYGLSRSAAVNEFGDVAGTENGPCPCSNAFFRPLNGSVISLGTLYPFRPEEGEQPFSGTRAINNLDQIVGFSGLSQFNQLVEQRAFFWEKGNIFDLNNFIANDSGWFLTEATGINDVGQIVGQGTINGKKRAFLLNPVADPKPVPEPASALGLLAFGALGAASGLRRKQKSGLINSSKDS
jgi:probable HAF family extracellular repeat protein